MKTKTTIKRIERTDIHCPKNFKPEDYQYLCYIYLENKDGFFRAPKYRQSELCSSPRKMLAEKGWKDGNFANKSQTCDHCGAFFKYGALFLHKPTDTIIVVGHICADEAFGCNDRREYDYKKLKKMIDKEVKEAKAEQKKAEAIEKYNITEEEINHRYSYNLRLMFMRGVTVTEHDIITMRKNIEWYNKEKTERAEQEAQREKERQEREKAHQAELAKLEEERVASEKAKAEKLAEIAKENVAPVDGVVEGRIEITGEVISVKLKQTGYGSKWKTLIKDTRGFKVWGSLPYGISTEAKGQIVKFTATVTKSPSDKMFGFFSCPKDAMVMA